MRWWTRRGIGSGRGGIRASAACAGVFAVFATLVAGALRLVDPTFTHFYRSVDFDRPADFFAEPDQIGPSDIALAYWAGTGPLEMRLGKVARGDVVKLMLRADTGECSLAVRAGRQSIATLRVADVWVQHEIVSSHAGESLVLEPVEPLPCPVHVSRITVSNVSGHSRGSFPIYVRHSLAGAPEWPGFASAWLLGLPFLVAALLVAWRWKTGAPRWSAALLGTALNLLPAAAVVGIAEVLHLVGGRFVVMPPRTFVALVVVPAAVMEIVRCRAAAVAPLRRLASGLVSVLAAVPRAIAGFFSSGRLGALLAPCRRAAVAVGGTVERLAASGGFDTVGARAAAAGTLTGRRLAVATAVFCVVLAVIGGVFATVVVQDFEVPLFGTGDLSLWGQQNHYVARNLTFTPLPRLDLDNDQLFYPYGGSNVFQPWVFELHLAASTAERMFGPWGWCQLYFVFSVIVTALGAFLLLVRDHGAWRAGLAALAVSFCGYYAIGKYAGQFSISCVHWTVLSVLADFVLFGRVFDRRPWSARLLLARVFLLFACLGLELGYVAGLGLTSALLTAVFAGIFVLDRSGWNVHGLRGMVGDIGRQLRDSVLAHPVHVGLLALAAGAAAWLYVPLVLQVAAAAREFVFTGTGDGCWWANPLRMLQPILPGFNPITHGRLFDDSPEGAFAASPGVALVLCALVGLVAGRGRLPAALPALAMLVLLLSYHPLHFGHLRALPWFSFARVTGRFTVVYPALLAVLALFLPAGRWRWRGRIAAAGLAALLAVEAATAYRAYLIKDWHFPRLDADFNALMDAVRNTPGEAVLDWPFCIAGGNGVATGSLCRYYHRQCGIASFQMFHGKKIVGAYFGRLHPSQIEPYLDAGWPRLFMPDERSPFKARRQRRDFESDEWEFMERFVRLGDFSGVLLHVDRLPPETVAGFHSRFGPPAAAAATLFGRVEFIPKPAAWRADVDPVAARRLVVPLVLPALPPGRLVSMGIPATDEYLGPGWGAVWKGCRTSEARSVELRFRTEASGPQRLRMMGGTFRAQRVAVRVNGVEVGELRHDGGALRILEVTIPAGILRRDNVVRFDLPEARSPRSLGLNDDPRLLGLTVEWFRLDAAQR